MTITAYDAGAIRVLKGLESIRRRPSMYIGSTGRAGVFHLLFEVVQNAVDEALAGFCTYIEVICHTDGSFSVEDNARGIPTDIHPDFGRPGCEVVMTELYAGSKFDNRAYKLAGGMHGVGLTCVNALSSSVALEIWRDGHAFRQGFGRGVVTSALEVLGPASRTGTKLRFTPDPEIFEDTSVDRAAVAQRLEELAFLHPGLKIRLVTADRDVTYCYESGISGFVAHLNESRHPLHPVPIRLEGRQQDIRVEVALQWTTAYAEDVRSYVNSIATYHGGTHVDGLNAALLRTLHRYALSSGLLHPEVEETIEGYDIRDGMTCVLSVQMTEPEFEGQTKGLLTSPSVRHAVDQIVSQSLLAWLEGHPTDAAAVVGKALEASRARAAARRAGERARYQSVDASIDKEVYRQQFGIRSKNWHDSARWITDNDLLGAHAAMCRVGPDAQVLDVCCGSGVVGASFRGRVGHITGLDLTPEMIKLSQTRLDNVVRGDVYEIPFPEASFDLVCNREVLHLLPRPEKPLAQIFRVLKPGGQFIFGQLVPYGPEDAPWMFRILKKKQPLFFNNFLAEDLVRLLSGTGFVNIEVSEVFQWEDIDLWIDTHETPNLYRHEIRRMYYEAPAEVRRVHPFEVSPSGAIQDRWRWCIYSAFKPGNP